jgi:hypothetical protein
LRKQINVIYELNLITGNGEEVKEEFSYQFDRELYEEDMDGTDIMTINFLMQDMKKKYGDDVFLMDFSVDRGNHRVH